MIHGSPTAHLPLAPDSFISLLIPRISVKNGQKHRSSSLRTLSSVDWKRGVGRNESSLASGTFHLCIAADNHAYCVQCFAQKYNPKCAGCQETLVDTCLLALDRHWHPRCFTCSSCNRPLPNGEFYLVDDKPYDLDCHWAKRLEKREHMERGER
ncbi:Protein CBG03641 [Caenorhabditis briggsae]|uniref:Protein CBG03641 n=1 Tax=Caenorhabditis briggsae TaxID=6238 RepID=A8WVH9_CAEBR|nr:Protein CBG03641 [Caenorhabditis briggsae]CAP24490.2 Protein CBG03641 [Caenorhabditis briggsae]